MIPSPRSPVRTQQGNSRHAEQADPFYPTYSAAAQAEILVSVAQREKNDLVVSALQVQNALRGANDDLQYKKKLLSDAQREMATFAADRTRLLSTLLATQNALDEELAGQRRSIEHLESQVHRSGDELGRARMEGQDHFNRLEATQRSVAELTAQVKQLSVGLESMAAEQHAAAAAHRSECKRLEGSIKDQERGVEKIQEQVTQIEKAAGIADHEHATHCDKARAYGVEVRSAIQEASRVVDGVRSRLDTMESENEEAARRRRVNLDEQQRQDVAERRALLQDLHGKRQELSRRHRTETHLMGERYRNDIDAAANELSSLRDAATAQFERELTLHDAVRAAKAELVGVEGLAQRLQLAEELAAGLSQHLHETQAHIAALSAELKERETVAEALRAKVAPLPDVESAISAHGLKASAFQKAMADVDAERAVLAVRRTEREEADGMKRQQLAAELRNAVVERDRHREDVALRASALEGDLRNMETERMAIANDYQNALERNKQLDQALERITKQRRALAEETALRRDAARMAAQSLLAQLE